MEVPIHGGINTSWGQLCEQKELFVWAASRVTHVELSFEDLISGNNRKAIEAIAATNKLIISSKSLNLGSTDELNFEVLKSLRGVQNWLKPEILHEALSWSALKGHHSFLELPFPLTEANLELLVERLFRIQECLGRKLAIRNLSPHLNFVGAEFTQEEFLFELARITGCDIAWEVGPNQIPTGILPKDFVSLNRLSTRSPENSEVDAPLCVVYGGSWEEQIERLSRLSPAQQNILDLPTNRLALDPIPRREVELKEGVFESEPRQILMDEVTRGFGIRTNADVAIFESETDPRNGLAIYNQQYFIQVRNLLQAQYRAVSHALSGQFDRIVVDYLMQYPPTEPFITSVGREFEEFLRETSSLPNGEVLADLARLEYSIFEIMNEPEQASIDQGVMMEIASNLWDRVIFKLNDQLRLVEANFDVSKVQKAILTKGKMPDSPRAMKTNFLVYRKDDKAFVQLIGRPEAKALRYAWDEMTFIKICERIKVEEDLQLDDVIQQTFSFIHRWAGLGLVKAFDFKAPAEVINFEGSPWDHES